MPRIIKYLFFLSLFLLLAMGRGMGQGIIKGKVMYQDSKDPLRSINVMAIDIVTSETLAFAFTNQNGIFQIEFATDQDSVLISFKSMTTRDFILKTPSKSQELEIYLEEKEIELNEFTLEGIKNPITQKKDTIEYTVSSFQNTGDRHIIDVLRRLPGIDVNSNGTINYQGKAIQKFYIEGLDLLEGKYNLATKNLPVDAVKSIEVLENHQPIRMLDSLEFNPRTSLNLTLKKKDVLIGNGHLGAGIPGLWDLKIAPMLFNANSQTILSAGTNNTGNELSGEVKNLYSGNLSPSQPNPPQWFNISSTSNDEIDKNRVDFNRSHLGSINHLFKTKKALEIKVLFDFSLEKVENQFSNRQTYLTGADTLDILTSGIQNQQDKSFNFNLGLLKNTDNNYLKNNLKIKYKDVYNNQIRLFNDTNNSQGINNNQLVINNEFNKLLNFKNKIIDFKSTINVIHEDPDLIVQPYFLAFQEGLGTGDMPGRQTVKYNNFYIDNSMTVRKLSLLGIPTSLILGNYWKREKLASELLIPLSPIFENQENKMDFEENTSYANASWNFVKKNSNITLKAPLKFSYFKNRETESEIKPTYTKLFFEPGFFWQLELGQQITNRLSLSRRISVGNISDLYTGYIASNYQLLNTNSSDLPVSKNNILLLNQSFKDPLISLFINSTFTANFFEKNTLTENTILPNGGIVINSINRTNTGKTFTWVGDASKYIPKLRTSLFAGLTLTRSVVELFLNSQLQNLTYSQKTLNFRLSYRPVQILNFEIQQTHSIVNSKAQESFDNKVWRNKSNVNLYIFPIKNHQISLTYAALNFKSNLNSSRSNINFLDFDYSVIVPKTKFEFHLSGQNLLNKNFSFTTSNSSYLITEQSLLLRPRQFVLKAIYAF
ncbi:Plug domain-containing protein [Rhodonellum sp.]|uniref:Plug domain-containing protein n=1 Tax=Rhodonellum sp. TaxID=2231180 RepID=UPI00272771E4|nr:Plug domain-containing protein [Rhodonellum sp.]MDO9554279.1 Plug domain-containing protein [Rhodonellum sp.]